MKEDTEDKPILNEPAPAYEVEAEYVSEEDIEYYDDPDLETAITMDELLERVLPRIIELFRK